MQKRQTRKYPVQRVIALVLTCMIMLSGVGGLFAVPAFANDGSKTEVDVNIPNLTLDGVVSDAVIPEQLVAGIIGSGLLPTEANYLNSHSAYKIMYSKIPDGMYRAIYQAGDILAVASEYAYTASSGIEVKVVPMYIEKDGLILPMSWSDKDNAYTAKTKGDFGDSVRFIYSIKLDLDENTSDLIANEAYNAAQGMSADREEYALLIADWTQKNDAYEEYLALKSEFDMRYEAYEKYCAELSEYNKLKAEFDAWNTLWEDYQKYLENQKLLSDHDAALDRYNEYIELINPSPEESERYEREITAARAHLATFDMMFAEISLEGHSLFDVVTSSLISTVMANKDELITLGGSEADIDNAEMATFYIKKILTEYSALNSNSEKYAHVKANLSDLIGYLSLLDTSLKNLTAVKSIANQIKAEGFEDEFIEFSAMLYYCETILSNEKSYDENTVVYGANVSTVLDASKLIEDKNDLVPLEGGWPAPLPSVDNTPAVEHPGARPNEITWDVDVPFPKEEDRPTEPIEPEPIEDPSDSRPDEVEDPGDAPKEPELDAEESALLDAYDTGLLQYRHGVSGGKFDISVYGDTEAKTYTARISVYNSSGLIGTKTIRYGDDLGKFLTPERDCEKDGVKYIFVGWSYEPDGEPMDTSYLAFTNAEFNIYAVFEPQEPQQMPDDTDAAGDENDAPSIPTEPSKPNTSIDIGEVPKVNFFAKLSGKIGLVPMLIICGALAGVIISCTVILPVVIIDKKRAKKK